MIKLTFILFYFIFMKFVNSEVIIIDTNEDNRKINLDPEYSKVINIFLDSKSSNNELSAKYASVLSKNPITINEECDYIKNLIKGRSLKYLNEEQTKQYVNSKDTYHFYIYAYTINNEPELIKKIYAKHPKYVSYLTSCKPENVFDDIRAVEENKNFFHTTPIILSQLIIVVLMTFFLIIGFYILANISTPKIFEEKPLICKEH